MASSLDISTDVALVDTRTAAGSIQLPSTTSIPYRVFTIKDAYGSFGSNALTLTTQGSETFEDGSTSKLFSDKFSYITLYGNTQNGMWQILSATQYNQTGGMLRVDAIYGNDTVAATNKYQYPFKTIAAAMSNTVAGNSIWVLPGTYNEAVVFSNSVSLRGANISAVTIVRSNVTVNTTLITMATLSRLEDVTLRLTSSSSNVTQLTGILFSNVQGNAKIRTIVGIFDNSATPSSTNSNNIYGIYSTGTSSTNYTNYDEAQRCSFSVYSAGPGRKRTIYLDGSNKFNLRDTNFICSDSGGASNNTGFTGGSFICAETNSAGSQLFIKTSSVAGFSNYGNNTSADVSQTQGTITIAFTDLYNRNANGYGLTFNSALSEYNFSITGALKYFHTGGAHAYLNNNWSGKTFLIPGSMAFYGGVLPLDSPYPIRLPNKYLITSYIVISSSSNTGTNMTQIDLYKNGTIMKDFRLQMSTSTTYIANTVSTLKMTSSDYFSVELSTYDSTGGAITNTTNISNILVQLFVY